MVNLIYAGKNGEVREFKDIHLVYNLEEQRLYALQNGVAILRSSIIQGWSQDGCSYIFLGRPVQDKQSKFIISPQDNDSYKLLINFVTQLHGTHPDGVSVIEL